MFKKAFTMMELVIAMAVIALIVLVTIPIAKNKMEKVDKYSYYLAYAAVQDIAANIVAQSEYEYSESDIATSSVEDIWKNKQYVAYKPNNNIFAKYSNLFNGSNLSYLHMYAIEGIRPVDPVDGAECPATDKVNGICRTEYINTHYTCHLGFGPGYNSDPFISYQWLTKNPSACTDYVIDADNGYSGACLWGGDPTGGEDILPYPDQPNSDRVDSYHYRTDNGINAQNDWWCFKYKPKSPTPTHPINPINPPTLNPTPGCTAGQYEDAIGVCKNCSDITTWEEYKTHIPPCPFNCERFGMVYSASKGTCVMPASATNLCERIKADYNIRNSACDVTAAVMRARTASGFQNVTPHIKLSNGLQIYIASDLVKIDALADAPDVRDRVGYLLYVDVNGTKGKGILYQDVYPFYIMMAGKILPVYNPAGTGGANSVENLSGNIIYDDYSTGNRVVKASQTNVNYQTGVCATRYIQSASYCGAIPVDAHCADANADCRYIVNKPMKFFGR